jgi:transcriptional regulator with XRE-family HTH domain
MSQMQLAKMVGAGVRSVGRWERGKAVPRSHIGSLEAVLGISLTEEAAEPWYDENDPVERAIAEDSRIQPEARRRKYVADLRAQRMQHLPRAQEPPAG